MRKAFGLVEQVGQILVPYELTHLPDGEAIKFNYSLMIKLIFKSFGLEEAEWLEREVGLSLSIDGATLTKFLGHVMAGFKIKDKAAVNPFTKQSTLVSRQFRKMGQATEQASLFPPSPAHGK
jgi:SPX domain protein involved in polyphosphate accumulation